MRMIRNAVLTFALAIAAFGVAQPIQAQPVIVEHRDYNWDHPYWRTHNDGYWHGRHGYWRHRHHRHVFIELN